MESGLKIACIPRVCDIASAAGVGHQKMNLFLRVRWDYASYPTEIKPVHTDDQIECVVVFATNLSSCLVPVERCAVLFQAVHCRRIYMIADFFSGCGRTFDIESPLKPIGLQKSFEYEFSHRRAANVAMAHKKDSYHNCAKIFTSLPTAKVSCKKGGILYHPLFLHLYHTEHTESTGL